jgi:hypothetical protein
VTASRPWWIGGGAILLAVAAQAATFRETTDSLILENQAARYVFSRQFRGSVVGMVDRATGIDFQAGLPYPAALFELITSAGCDSGSLHNLSDGSFTYQGMTSSSSASLELSYTGVGNHSLSVSVRVAVTDTSPRADWRIEVHNDDAGLRLRSVTFPFVLVRAQIGVASSDDALAFPVLDGVVVHDPAQSFAPGEGMTGGYPADLSLQMMALYDGSAGLYLAVPDGGGRTKWLGYTRVSPEGVAAAALTVRHAVPERPGEDFLLPYGVELGPFHGDWFDAATRYRQWASGQLWWTAPLAGRADLPTWWRTAQPVISSASYGDDGVAILPAALMPARAEEYGDFVTRAMTLLTFGWEKHGAWTSPDYFPPRDGDAAFRAATQALHAAGHRAYVYESGTVWRLKRSSLPGYDDTARFEAEGRPWAAESCDGQPVYDPFYASIGWPSVRMCPATSYWQDSVVAGVTGAARLGIDVVSIDEFPIGSLVACHAAGHGHPPGEGEWQGVAYRALLRRCRLEGRAIRPELAFTCEEGNELYVDLLDGYVSRNNLPDGWMYGPLLRRWGERFEAVPLFAAVYHERLLAVAEQVIVYDNFQLGEQLRTSRAQGLARSFVLGKMPGAAIAPLSGGDPALLEMFRRVAMAVAGPAHEFAVNGRLLRPPAIAVPRVAFQWADIDPATGALVLRDETAPAVVAGAFEAPSGARAVLLGNITAQTVDVDVPLDPGELPPPFVVSQVLDGVTSLRLQGASLPATVRLTLPGYAVAQLAIASQDPAATPPRLRPRLSRP